MPGHTFLYSPPVKKIKELIDAGELGEIYFISSSRVNLGLHQPDVSVVWDLGPHDFSILSTGSVAAVPDLGVQPQLHHPGLPDVAFIELAFPSGTIAHVELAWLSPSKLRRTAIVGSPEDGRVRRHGDEPVRIFDRAPCSGSRDLRRVPAELPDGRYRLPARSTPPSRWRSSCPTSAVPIRTGGEPRS